MKVCVIIPTYNESDTIGNLVSKIKKLGFDVLVIDDGSTDNTREIVKGKSVLLLENNTNLGKGSALRRGFDYAILNEYDFVVTMDGDGQHSPTEIVRFIELAQKERAGIIVGDRMQNCIGMSWVRQMTNSFMSRFISRLAGQHIPDTQCGFRLIKIDVLKNIKLISQRFEIESEILIKAARSGFKVISTPIKTIYQGEKSKISPFIDTLRFVRLIINVKNERR